MSVLTIFFLGSVKGLLMWSECRNNLIFGFLNMKVRWANQGHEIKGKEYIITVLNFDGTTDVLQYGNSLMEVKWQTPIKSEAIPS